MVLVAEPRLARWSCVSCFGGDIVIFRDCGCCGCGWEEEIDEGEEVGVGNCWCGLLKNVDIDF